MLQTILVLGLTPSDSDYLHHNFLAAMFYLLRKYINFKFQLVLLAELIVATQCGLARKASANTAYE